MITTPWFHFAVALGLGLLIGLERERKKGEGPTRRPAGIRTFGLTSLLGAIAIHVGGVSLLVVVTAGVIALAALSHFRARDEDPGLTTEIGLVTMPLLGGVAMSDTGLAATLGVAIAVVFAAKAPLHGFVRRVLSDAEVNDGLVFAVATVVIWPQLPDRYLGPLDAINPHSVWLLVVLLLALGACGHIATRALGQRFGLPIAGLASGFVSSTATIGSMASRAAKDAASIRPAVAGAALSSVATFVQMALLLMTISKPTLVLMAPALAAGMIVATIYGLAFLPRRAAPETPTAADPGRAFSIGTTLWLTGTMVVMLLIAAALRRWLGETGIIAGAIVAGFIDTHSAAISVASLVPSATLTPMEAALPILAAMTSNAVAKMAMAVGAGAPGFALRIVPGIVLSIGAAWAVAMPMILQ
ncbi:MAG: MgtC/SapB family protein [Alphaproteobacteria bacterium]|nr:MgtC/SapB family protein [Alphaproteobacteria bacterium]